MWPGIPTGRGWTCAEEGCGNRRRPHGHDCRPCYKSKHQKDRRARGVTGDGAGGYEVSMTDSVVAELDAASYREWQRVRDEFT